MSKPDHRNLESEQLESLHEPERGQQLNSPQLESLRRMVNGSKHVVFFGGAGVSTESGIPDFRSQDGLYNLSYKFPPETMLSNSFYRSHREEFFRFYRDKVLHADAKPNAAHRALASLEQAGHIRAVITQNIDGLHQAAGSKLVLELHGSVHRNYCELCGASYSLADILAQPGAPFCTRAECGGEVKPDVVLYEEPLDGNILERAVAEIECAEVLIIGGTSLMVNPAASLLRFFGGEHIVIINRDATPRDQMASLVFHDSICEVLGAVAL